MSLELFFVDICFIRRNLLQISTRLWLVLAEEVIMVYIGEKIVCLCCFLVHTSAIINISALMVQQPGSIIFLATIQGIAYLLYPVCGLLADIWFTRYKIVLVSAITSLITSVLCLVVAILGSTFGFWNDTSGLPEHILMLLCFLMAVLAIATIASVGVFEANAIQFGMDQIVAASSNQLSTFVHWYYWSMNLGMGLTTVIATVGLAVMMFMSCQMHIEDSDGVGTVIGYFGIISTLIQLVASILLLVILLCFKKHLTIEPAGYNPFTTVYKVLKYAWQHKCPENRSAFTYWEEDIPRRIDLGKNKYGGPFTTEEVEDTKTFFRILLLLVSLFGFHLSGNGFTVTRQLMHQLCPSSWLLLLLTTSPPLLDTLTALAFTLMLHFIFLPYLRRFVPNLLKRLGVGLILAFLTELTGILITCSTISLVNHVQSDCCYEENCKTESDVENCYKSKFYFNVNGTCNQTDSHAHHYDENCVDHTFALILIPQLLRSLSSLFVFMTALEFICAQAPLRMKGLLIGIWYATSAMQHLIMFPIDEYINKSTTSWLIFHGVRGFFILVSILLYCYVAKHYRYRQRDEVVNEQFLIEEIYERQLLQAEQYERERQPNSASCNADIYGSFQNETLLN